jgi:hypothetical protein
MKSNKDSGSGSGRGQGSGGSRAGSGRKKQYGEETCVIRVPKSRVQEVKAYLKQSEQHSQQSEQLERLKVVFSEYMTKALPFFEKNPSQRGAYRQLCYFLNDIKDIFND